MPFCGSLPFSFCFLSKKSINIFENRVIGHILFKFVLYNNYNYDFRKESCA